jgi:hypothetical protein
MITDMIMPAKAATLTMPIMDIDMDDLQLAVDRSLIWGETINFMPK